MGLTVHCEDAELRSLLLTHYGHMQSRPPHAGLVYRVGRVAGGGGFFYARGGQPACRFTGSGEFLAVFDGDVTLALQHARPHLYFLHAAALVADGRASLLVAPSGGGKSVSSWALSHHGFTYLSDELAPIDLGTMMVHPYTRGLCLKRRPPAEYPLSPGAISTSSTIHTPVGALPGGAADGPRPLGATFFLQYQPDCPQGSLRSVSAGEAAARLYANSLNPLAHPAEGLEAAVRLAAASPGYAVTTPDLGTTCRLIRSAVRREASRDWATHSATSVTGRP